MITAILVILFIYFVCFYALPWLMRYARRRVLRKFASGLGFDPDAFTAKAGPRRGHAQPRPEPRKKKIDPSMGEYVAFEEIHETKTRSSSSQSTRRTVYNESQVVDAEWEDIK